jgi:hypothetical protein
MAYIIRSNGTVEQLSPRKKFTLEDLQAAVGGYIEAIPGSHNRAFCNEEGLLRNLPLNPLASEDFHRRLVGDVVVLEKGDHQ